MEGREVQRGFPDGANRTGERNESLQLVKDKGSRKKSMRELTERKSK